VLMSRKRISDIVRENVLDAVGSFRDTWGADEIYHYTPCELKKYLWELVRSSRVSIQDRHLARYVLRFVKYPSLTEFNAYLANLGVAGVTQIFLAGTSRAQSIVPDLCRRYAGIGPCTKKRSPRRFL